jgi:hypothetical protein
MGASGDGYVSLDPHQRLHQSHSALDRIFFWLPWTSCDVGDDMQLERRSAHPIRVHSGLSRIDPPLKCIKTALLAGLATVGRVAATGTTVGVSVVHS